MSTQELSPKHEEFWIFSFEIWAQHYVLFFQYNRATKRFRPFLRILLTRPKPAYGRQGLDWIVGPGYSFVVFSTVGQSDHFS